MAVLTPCFVEEVILPLTLISAAVEPSAKTVVVGVQQLSSLEQLTSLFNSAGDRSQSQYYMYVLLSTLAK